MAAPRTSTHAEPRKDTFNRKKEPQAPAYDPTQPPGMSNPRPTGNGDETGYFEQGWYDPDNPDHVKK